MSVMVCCVGNYGVDEERAFNNALPNCCEVESI